MEYFDSFLPNGYTLQKDSFGVRFLFGVLSGSGLAEVLANELFEEIIAVEQLHGAVNWMHTIKLWSPAMDWNMQYDIIFHIVFASKQVQVEGLPDYKHFCGTYSPKDT